MKLVNFTEVNCTYAKGQSQYRPLPCHRTGDQNGRIICCWELSFIDRLKVLLFGRLWHSILTFDGPLQPQLLEIEKPVQYLCGHDAKAT